VDFLLVISELFSLCITAETLSCERISIENRRLCRNGVILAQNLMYKGSSLPIILLVGILGWSIFHVVWKCGQRFFFILSHLMDKQTDRQTYLDSNTVRMHSRSHGNQWMNETETKTGLQIIWKQSEKSTS